MSTRAVQRANKSPQQSPDPVTIIDYNKLPEVLGQPPLDVPWMLSMTADGKIVYKSRGGSSRARSMPCSGDVRYPVGTPTMGVLLDVRAETAVVYLNDDDFLQLLEQDRSWSSLEEIRAEEEGVLYVLVVGIVRLPGSTFSFEEHSIRPTHDLPDGPTATLEIFVDGEWPLTGIEPSPDEVAVVAEAITAAQKHSDDPRETARDAIRALRKHSLDARDPSRRNRR